MDQSLFYRAPDPRAQGSINYRHLSPDRSDRMNFHPMSICSGYWP